jgi:hypothetical protein
MTESQSAPNPCPITRKIETELKESYGSELIDSLIQQGRFVIVEDGVENNGS